MMKKSRTRRGGLSVKPKTGDGLATAVKEAQEAGAKERLKKEISPPEDVLAAAELAPRVFSIGAYYLPIRLMRKKGYSWRYTADWLKMFGIDISYVHLRRLFAQEDERLSELEVEEMKERGIPEEIVRDAIERSDPAQRIPAPDPGEEDAEIREDGP